MRHISSAHFVFLDGSLCQYLNCVKDPRPIWSRVGRSGFIPSATRRSKYGSFSHFLCSLSSFRCLAGASSPKQYSRSCLVSNFISSSVSKLLKNNSRDNDALTTTGISATVCFFLRAATLSPRAAIKNASALSAQFIALARARFRRVRTETGLGGFGFTVLGGFLARLLVFRLAFQNLGTWNGNDALCQSGELIKRGRLGWLGVWHGCNDTAGKASGQLAYA